MCLWWAGFPIYTASMRGSCVTSADLIFAVCAVSGRALVLRPIHTYRAVPLPR
jgi:hypothetical protein